MSQVTHPHISHPDQAHSSRAILLAGLIAMAATAALLVALALGSDSTATGADAARPAAASLEAGASSGDAVHLINGGRAAVRASNPGR